MNRLNDAPVLDQLDGHWQKLATLILWKLNGRKVVRISHEDMKRFEAEFAPGVAVMFTHGMYDAIEFSIVTQEQARAISEHDTTMRGTS